MAGGLGKQSQVWWCIGEQKKAYSYDAQCEK